MCESELTRSICVNEYSSGSCAQTHSIQVKLSFDAWVSLEHLHEGFCPIEILMIHLLVIFL